MKKKYTYNITKYHAGVDDKKHEDEDDHRKVILTLPYLGPISIILIYNNHPLFLSL